MLSLTKWYLDVVTVRGTALIAYAASLRWGAVHVGFASTLVSRPDGRAEEKGAWSGGALPEEGPGEIRFRHDGLELEGRWRGTSPPVGATLHEDERGRLRWDCLLPSAAGEVRLGGEDLEGQGYVERLTMTVPPWSLPLDTLRWGRFASPTHALVWISWDGGPPRRWAWLDGAAQADPAVGEHGVAGLEGDRRLTLEPVREMCDRRALQVLSRRLPALDAVPLGPLRDLRETKRLARATLRRGGRLEDEGWAIHELVSW